MKCLQCHDEYPPGMHFCGHCGASLPVSAPGMDIGRTQTLVFSTGAMPDGMLIAGRYLVIDNLGKGGMGHVYRVLDTKVDEEVALKFINPAIAANAKVIERFRNELKITRKITHRHVCRMYHLGEEGGLLFITMEYIAGEDLAKMIKRLVRLPVERGFIIAQQVCEGLSEVHRLGVVHRDLKPKNIMIDREGNAKIMDFGLARVPCGVRLTEAGEVVGTPSFMSPEQVNGELADDRSDIFSLGIILYTMLTGELPYKADSTLKLALMHKSHQPPHPSTINPRIPKELGRIILKCLEVDRTRRYQSAEDLLAALRGIGKSFDTYDIHIPGRETKSPAEVPASVRAPRTKALIASALVLILAASGLAARTFIRKSRLNEVRRQTLQETDRLVNNNQFSAAFQLARKLEKEMPKHGQLAALWPRMSSTTSVRTTPPGAVVSWRDEESTEPVFVAIGQTPLDEARIPLGHVRIRVELTGHETVEDATPALGGTLHFLLAPHGSRKPDQKIAWIDEIARTDTRESHKVNVGLSQGVKIGDQGTILSARGRAQPRKDLVIARFLVVELSRDRASIDVFAQKDVIRLGDIVRFDAITTTVPVVIETEPARAGLFIDGVAIGLSGDSVMLAPGEHILKLVKPGYQEHTTTIDVRPDNTTPLKKRYVLTPQTPALATLEIASDPLEADVYLDGSAIPAGRTPFVKQLPPGQVTVRIAKMGREEHVDEVTLHAEGKTQRFYSMPAKNGLVEILSSPSGADIWINGEYAGATPCRKDLVPGTYKLKIGQKGMGEREESFTLRPGEMVKLGPYVLSAPSSFAASHRYHLTIRSDPPGASVYINGDLQDEKTPLIVDCQGAEVVVKIIKEEFRAKEERVSLKPLPAANERSYSLQKLAKAQLTISTSDPAQVYLDGKLLGTVPPMITADTFEGPHRLRWVLEGIVQYEETVTVAAGETVRAHFNKEDHRDLFRTGSYDISANPGAALEVDGQAWGSVPPKKTLRVEGGPHSIRFVIRDILGATLVIVVLDDVLEAKGNKKLHVSAESVAYDPRKNPDFPPGSLDKAGEDGVVLRSRRGALEELAFSVDGQHHRLSRSEEPLKARVPSKRPHLLRFDIANSRTYPFLEARIYCPDIGRLLLILVNVTGP